MRKKQFKAESKRLLDLMINSIYTHKEIFLREIISNASDAIDKLCYLSLTDDKVGLNRQDFRILLAADPDSRTLTVSDNGIGMDEDDLEHNLGVIANSGSFQFKGELEGKETPDTDIIGQFGVGFYSAFIVADKVTVESRSAKAAANEAVRWESTGEGTYTSETITREARGTSITLHLKPDCEEFLETWTVRTAITKYSDHISVPVLLWEEK